MGLDLVQKIIAGLGVQCLTNFVQTVKNSTKTIRNWKTDADVMATLIVVLTLNIVQDIAIVPHDVLFASHYIKQQNTRFEISFYL